MFGWSEPVITAQPTAQPVTLDQARAHVRADTSDDTMTALYLASAIDLVQAWTGLGLCPQTVQISRPRLDTRMALAIGPVQEITGITYLDVNGAQQTLNPASYVATGLGTMQAGLQLAQGQSWPMLYQHPACITLTANIGYPSAIPPAIVQAILLLVGDFYANREDTIAERGVNPATLPNGVTALLANYRIW